MKNFLVLTRPEEKKKFDLQLARFIYATNTPFNHVEHPEFLKLVEMLHPGYKPANRKQVGGELLDEVYSLTQDKLRDELKGKVLNMSLDGWSNVRNDSIICVCVSEVLKKRTYLIDTIDTGAESHTGDYLVKIATASIKKCESFQCTVRSLVTDNAANMNKMRETLAQQEDLANHPGIITYGCSSHILNLLAHDLNVTEITDEIKSIMKYFKYTHFASAKYKEAGGKAIVLPQQVRWNTMADCLKTYLENWHIMSDICMNNAIAINSDMISKVNNIELKMNAQYLYKKLENIAITLDVSQKASCTLGEVTQAWINLKKKFEEEDTAHEYSLSDLQKFNKRYEMALTSAHYLANLLDPKFRGKDFTNENIAESLLYIETYHKMAMPDIIKYRAMSDPFHGFLFNDHVINNVNALEWWLSLKSQIDARTMDLVTQLHSAVASSAGVERLFSTFGFIHSDVRNRLGTDKAAKLVAIFQDLNRNK